MEYEYEIITTELGEIIVRSDGASIPKDNGNVDYQEYLKSLKESSN